MQRRAVDLYGTVIGGDRLVGTLAWRF
jgi:hypothetical protein